MNPTRLEYGTAIGEIVPTYMLAAEALRPSTSSCAPGDSRESARVLRGKARLGPRLAGGALLLFGPMPQPVGDRSRLCVPAAARAGCLLTASRTHGESSSRSAAEAGPSAIDMLRLPARPQARAGTAWANSARLTPIVDKW